MAAPRAQRHADADLLGSLRHQVRHHAVDPDGCQQQRQTCERGQQDGIESLARNQAGDFVGHGGEGERDVLVDGAYLIAHFSDERQRIADAAHHQRAGDSIGCLIGCSC